MRTVKEWIGRTDDSRPPPSVRLRIFERHNGVCHISSLKIQAGQKWDVEHVIAICNGGENRESNMAPALIAPHKVKTKQDRATKQKNDRVKMRHWGIRKASQIQSRGFAKAAPQRRASKPLERWTP